MKNQLHRAYKQTKTKTKQNQVTSYSNGPRVLFNDLAPKHYNGITKGWNRCLTPESKGIFLVIGMLMFVSA